MTIVGTDELDELDVFIYLFLYTSANTTGDNTLRMYKDIGQRLMCEDCGEVQHTNEGHPPVSIVCFSLAFLVFLGLGRGGALTHFVPDGLIN